MKGLSGVASIILSAVLIVLLTSNAGEPRFAYAAATVSQQQATKIAGNMALFSDGTVWVWGDDPYGADGSTFTPKGLSAPIQVKELRDIVDIASGGSFSVALKKDGSVWVWGSGQFGGLGNGTSMWTEQVTFPMKGPKPYSQKPTPVKGLTDIIAVSAGGHTLALKRDDTVWAWGQNGAGQALAEDNSTSRTVTLTGSSTKALLGSKAVLLKKPSVYKDKQFWLPVNALPALFNVKAAYEQKNRLISIVTQ